MCCWFAGFSMMVELAVVLQALMGSNAVDGVLRAQGQRPAAASHPHLTLLPTADCSAAAACQPLCSQHPLASVRQSAEALHGAAKEFRRKTGAVSSLLPADRRIGGLL